MWDSAGARMSECLNVQVPFEYPSAYVPLEYPSAYVPFEYPIAYVPLEYPSFSSAQVHKCLSSLRTQVPKYPLSTLLVFFECSFSKKSLQHYKKWAR